MSLSSLPAARSIPDDITVIIEIPSHSSPVKYEVDKDSGLLEVDRLMTTAMYYPCNYGFVPNTLAGDGDPVDVLVHSPYALQPGSVIRCRAIGLLEMTDEAGKDGKVMAVPTEKICPQFKHIQSIDDIGAMLRDSIAHFFEHYKDLEKGKWVKVEGWRDREAAIQEIESGIKAVAEAV